MFRAISFSGLPVIREPQGDLTAGAPSECQLFDKRTLANSAAWAILDPLLPAQGYQWINVRRTPGWNGRAGEPDNRQRKGCAHEDDWVLRLNSK